MPVKIKDVINLSLKKISQNNSKNIDYVNLYKFHKTFLKKIKFCKICNSNKKKIIKSVYLKKTIINQTAICRKCSHIYRSIFLNNEWFEKCFKKIELDQKKLNKYCNSDFFLKAEKDRMRRYRYYNRIIKKYFTFNQKIDILDIGAAYGTGSDQLKSKYKLVDCVEPEVNRVKILRRKGYFVYHSNFENTHIVKKYNIILAAHVFEHCEDIDVFVQKIKKIIYSDSIVFIEVPDTKKTLDFFDLFYLPHRNNFIINNLKFFFQKNNFKIIDYYKLSTKDEGFSWGLVLKINNKKIFQNQNKKINIRSKLSTFKHLLNLYNKNKPFNKSINKITKIYIDRITHFFYTIRIDNGIFSIRNNKIIFNHFNGKI